jgi:hypothetical protein
MRDDMARVIVERPRIPGFKSRKGRQRALEDLPKHEGLRRAQSLRGDRKQLNENLAPLRRYLEGQVGRPWNKVYAEIAMRLRVDNTVQQHVRDHLRDFVAITPRRQIHDWRTSMCGGLWWQPLYVNPVTGLLCRTDQLPEMKAHRRAMRHRMPAPIESIQLTEDRGLRLIRGLWYEMELAPLPEPVYRSFRETRKLQLKPYDRMSPIVEIEMEVRRLITPAVRDVATGAMIAAGPETDDEASWRSYRRGQPDRYYAIAKRVLSRRELRHHRLSNAPVDIG